MEDLGRVATALARHIWMLQLCKAIHVNRVIWLCCLSPHLSQWREVHRQFAYLSAHFKAARKVLKLVIWVFFFFNYKEEFISEAH